MDLSIFADKTWLLVAGIVLALIGLLAEWAFKALGKWTKYILIIIGVICVLKALVFP